MNVTPLSVDRYLRELASNLTGLGRARLRLLRELADHLEDAVAANIAHGLSPRDAEREALKQLGDVHTIGELWRARTERTRRWHRARVALATAAAAAVASILGITSAASGHRNPAPTHHISPAVEPLTADGIGPVHFGATKAHAVADLTAKLGKPTAGGVATGCGSGFTEVAWHDLVAEFRSNTFTGYRFIIRSWPVTVPGSPRDHLSRTAPVPRLRTATGITLGSTLRELRSAYGNLAASGAGQWKAPDGLRFTEGSAVHDTQASTHKIIEIQMGTCGAL